MYKFYILWRQSLTRIRILIRIGLTPWIWIRNEVKSWIRIRIKVKGWLRIRIEANVDLQHWPKHNTLTHIRPNIPYLIGTSQLKDNEALVFTDLINRDRKKSPSLIIKCLHHHKIIIDHDLLSLTSRLEDTCHSPAPPWSSQKVSLRH